MKGLSRQRVRTAAAALLGAVALAAAADGQSARSGTNPLTVSPAVGGRATVFDLIVRSPVDLRGHRRRQPTFVAILVAGPWGYGCSRRWERVPDDGVGPTFPAPLARRGARAVLPIGPPDISYVRRARSAQADRPIPGWCPGRFRVRVELRETADTARCLRTDYPYEMRGCVVRRRLGAVSFRVRPRPARVRVPNVVGENAQGTECDLALGGLRWRYQGYRTVHAEPTSCVGYLRRCPVVTAQRPAPRRRVKRGTVVVLATRVPTPHPRETCIIDGHRVVLPAEGTGASARSAEMGGRR
jgi:hypothetical protein